MTGCRVFAQLHAIAVVTWVTPTVSTFNARRGPQAVRKALAEVFAIASDCVAARVMEAQMLLNDQDHGGGTLAAQGTLRFLPPYSCCFRPPLTYFGQAGLLLGGVLMPCTNGKFALVSCAKCSCVNRAHGMDLGWAALLQTCLMLIYGTDALSQQALYNHLPNASDCWTCGSSGFIVPDVPQPAIAPSFLHDMLPARNFTSQLLPTSLHSP